MTNRIIVWIKVNSDLNINLNIIVILRLMSDQFDGFMALSELYQLNY